MKRIELDSIDWVRNTISCKSSDCIFKGSTNVKKMCDCFKELGKKKRIYVVRLFEVVNKIVETLESKKEEDDG